MDEILKMRQKRAELVAAAKEQLEVMHSGGDGAKEAEAKFDELMAKADALQANIDRQERINAAESDMAEEIEETAAGLGVSAEQLTSEEDQEGGIFHRWMLGGINNLSSEDRLFMNERRVKAAQTVGTDSAGGYLVPTGFIRKIEAAMKAFGGLAEVATVIRTKTGNPLNWPTMNDTANEGEIVGEGAAVGSQDVAFGQLNFGAYKYSTKSVLLSLEFLQDNEVGFVQNYLAAIMAERLARIHNRHFTVGTGTGQPEGLVTGAAAGVTGATAIGVTYDELIDLEHSIDPAYRNSSRFMFHDTTLRALRKMKDADGRPLWQESMRDGAPALINARPYTINQDMPELGSNAKSIAFGQMSKYHIRRVLDLSIKRLDEKYAEQGLVAFLGFERSDGMLVDAGAQPVKLFTNAA